MRYIYGLNKSGLSLIHYFIKKKLPFVAWDDNEEIRKKIISTFNNIVLKKPKDQDLKIIEEVFVTPGLSLNSKKLRIIKKNNIKMFRDLELYSRSIINQKIIAITGTNGKSTTTKLIGDLIQSNNKKCFVGGNIGTPLMNFKNLKNISKYHVIELSSFQLESAPSFKSFISILLNISFDHMDRYKNINQYVNEKKKILNHHKRAYNIISIDDIYCKKIFNTLKHSNKIPISILHPIKKGVFYCNGNIYDNYFFHNKLISINKISNSLSGSFNLQNILVTYAVSQILNLNLKKFLKLITLFKGLPHRLEKVFESNKVIVINNSKATNLDSTLKSITQYQNIYLIVGGRAKEKNFKPLIKYKKNILKCYLIGESASEIFMQISNYINSKKFKTLEKALKDIFNQLSNNNFKSTILFSPGCSSFDQFNNFEDRGEKFKAIIKQNIKNIN